MPVLSCRYARTDQMVTAPAVQPLSRAPAAFELIGRNRDYALHSLRISLRYIGYVAGRSSSSFRFRAASQGAAGLSKDSIALCHQVTTLDRAKLTQRMVVMQFQSKCPINFSLSRNPTS